MRYVGSDIIEHFLQHGRNKLKYFIPFSVVFFANCSFLCLCLLSTLLLNYIYNNNLIWVLAHLYLQTSIWSHLIVRSSSHLLRRQSQTCSTGGGTKRSKAVDRGRGVVSVMGKGARESTLHRSPRVVYPAWPWPKPSRYGEARKDKIEFCCVFWGEQLRTFTAYPLCPFWSLKSSIFTCKAVSFNMMASIFRFIVSVSLLTALPMASIKTGSLVRLWTAVPVFRIFR